MVFGSKRRKGVVVLQRSSSGRHVGAREEGGISGWLLRQKSLLLAAHAHRAIPARRPHDFHKTLKPIPSGSIHSEANDQPYSKCSCNCPGLR